MGVASKRSIFRSGCCVDFMCRGDKCHPSKGTSMKSIAWYDPTNGTVSTDKDSPLFTPLGQVWPLYTKQEQEPVAWIWEKEVGYTSIETHSLSDEDMKNVGVKGMKPLYTTPSQRTWVELDEEDYIKAYELCDFDKVAAFEFFEAKLKEKNVQR